MRYDISPKRKKLLGKLYQYTVLELGYTQLKNRFSYKIAIPKIKFIMYLNYHPIRIGRFFYHLSPNNLFCSFKNVSNCIPNL